MNFKRETLDVKGSLCECITIQTNEQNSVTRSSLLEFQAILEEVQNNPAIRAAVITSENDKFFCNGVDGAHIASTPAEKLPEEMGEIVKFFCYMIQFYKPLIAEISGHAMGGGAVIALACDYRYMLNQKGRVSFTEVFFGLPLPSVLVDKLKYTIDPRYLADMIYGEAYKADEALKIGFVHELADSRENLRKLTLKKLDVLSRMPISAFINTKMALHHETVERIDWHTKKLATDFSDPIIRKNLMEAMNAFTQKRRPKFE
ncbi:MAG: enoyl-CoA hydratase/isomerase family protein [Leptospirales bacterium]|nr:enoyl-CoA hydratase/isomerase family protein [Leptospirales bacterium]